MLPNPNYQDAYCPALQKKMDACVYMGGGYKTGLFAALVSPYNTQGVSFSQDTDGKMQNVQVNYPQKIDTSTVSSTLDLCATATEPLMGAIKLTPAMNRNIARTIDPLELKRICAPDADANKAMIIKNMVNALKAQIQTDIFAEFNLPANTGQIYGGGAPPSVNMVSTTTGAVNWDGAGKVLEQTQALGCDMAPILVGGGQLFNFSKGANVYCCNDAGVQGDKVVNMFAFFHDLQTGTATGVGVNKFIAMAPGSVIIVPFYANLIPSVNGPDEHFLFIDSETGFAFDIDLIWDKCAGVNKRGAWIITISLNFDIFWIPRATPTGPWPATHPLYNSNGTLIFPLV